MAEDDSDKTEEPSERKLGRAREEGQVVQSQEIKNWGMLLAGTLLVLIFVPSIMRDMTGVLRQFIAAGSSVPMDFEHLRLVLARLAGDVALVVWPLIIGMTVVGVAVNLAQTGLMWSPKKLQPDPSKMSPIKGAKRIFSSKQVVELLKGILKMGIVGGLGTLAALPFLADVQLMPAFEISALLDRLQGVAMAILMATVAAMTVIAAFDYAYQKFTFLKSMRMTKQELKDEHKQTDGDPQIKAKIRSIRMKRARERMMAAVPEADVVVTNPTHYAVAMAYQMEEMSAPRVIAKGVDEVALRIREVAEEHDVPIVENPPLAQALYATVELDEEVPPEHYKAVAEVIGYVMRLKGKMPPGAAARGIGR